MELEDKQDSSYTDGQELQLSDSEIETDKTSDELEIKSENNFEQNIHQNEHEKKLYEEVLEKLDIVKKTKKQGIQDESLKEKLKNEEFLDKIQNSETTQAKNQIEVALKQDFAKIQKLVKVGLINSAQGQNLKKQVLKKAFDKLVQAERIKREQIPSQQAMQKTGKTIDEFSKSNPDFFSPKGRKEVFDYLKSGNVILGEDEFNKISDVIRLVEKSAIERYLQKAAHEKTLRDSNENAKQRLTANAQKTSQGVNLYKSFTREQIGKMSAKEFAKYEKAIMEALKKGLIK